MKTFWKNYRLHVIGGLFAMLIVLAYASFFVNSKQSVLEVEANLQPNVVLSEFITNSDKYGQEAILKVKEIKQIEMKLVNKKSWSIPFGSKGEYFVIAFSVVTEQGTSRQAFLESYDDVVIKKMVRNTNDASRWDIYTDDKVYSMAVKDAKGIALRHLIQGLHLAMKPTPEELAQTRKAEWAKEAEKYAIKPTETASPAN